MIASKAGYDNNRHFRLIHSSLPTHDWSGSESDSYGLQACFVE